MLATHSPRPGPHADEANIQGHAIMTAIRCETGEMLVGGRAQHRTRTILHKGRVPLRASSYLAMNVSRSATVESSNINDIIRFVEYTFDKPILTDFLCHDSICMHKRDQTSINLQIQNRNRLILEALHEQYTNNTRTKKQ